MKFRVKASDPSSNTRQAMSHLDVDLERYPARLVLDGDLLPRQECDGLFTVEVTNPKFGLMIRRLLVDLFHLIIVWEDSPYAGQDFIAPG